MTALKIQTTGDPLLDKLITDYSNAVFDCGEWRDDGDDPVYDDDRKYAKYEDALIAAEKAREALYVALNAMLAQGKGASDV